MADEIASRNWLTPDLIVKALAMAVTLAGLYWGIVARVDSASSKVDALSSDLREIRASIPNREADKLIIQGLESRMDKLEKAYDVQDTWIRNTRERLAEHQWKP